MAVHQCAQFFKNPHLVHTQAFRHIPKYLASTSTYLDLPDSNHRLYTCGVVYRPDKEKYIKCYVYVEFYGGCNQAYNNNAENVISCSGYVSNSYAGFPVLWCSKPQTEITLGTT